MNQRSVGLKKYVQNICSTFSYIITGSDGQLRFVVGRIEMQCHGDVSEVIMALLHDLYLQTSLYSNISRPLLLFILSSIAFFLSLFVRWRSLKSSWRALRPWGCSAMKRATTRPSRTKRMETVQTASWGKDRSRYDMTSPFSQPWPPWLIADKHLCHNRCRIPYDQWSLLEEYVMDR